MKVQKGTIIRTIILVIALVNQIAIAAGHTTLQLDDATVTTLVNTSFTVVTAVWAFWKNNSFTKRALKADAYKKTL